MLTIKLELVITIRLRTGAQEIFYDTSAKAIPPPSPANTVVSLRAWPLQGARRGFQLQFWT